MRGGVKPMPNTGREPPVMPVVIELTEIVLIFRGVVNRSDLLDIFKGWPFLPDTLPLRSKVLTVVLPLDVKDAWLERFRLHPLVRDAHWNKKHVWKQDFPSYPKPAPKALRAVAGAN